MTSRLTIYLLSLSLLLAALIFTAPASAQDFFLADSWGNVYKSSASACTSVKLNACSSITEIAYYKDTLYTISFGYLYKTLASNPAVGCTYVTTFDGATNSLTVDSAGTVYAAGNNSIYSYTPSTGVTRLIGNLPPFYFPAGDLSFYKGKLYMASLILSDPNSSYLVEINLQNPSLSTPFMKLQSKNVFGCITLPKTCDKNGFYITGQEEYTSYLVEVDMENKVELPRKCVFDFSIWGAASYTESGTTTRPVIDSIANKPACTNEGNNGSIQILSGITGSKLTYKISNGTSNNTGLFTGLEPRTYKITVSGEDGCETDTTVTVSLATSPLVSATGIDPSCKNDDGQIIVQPGAAGMKYAINEGSYQVSNNFGNLAAGTYTITATNQSGCTAQQQVKLTLPIIDTTASSFTVINSTCNHNNGSVKATAPSALQPITYFLNSTNSSATGYFQSLQPSSYLLSIKDAKGCRFDTSIVIRTTPVPFIDSIGSQAVCANENNSGSLKIYVKNSDETLSYSINNSVSNHTGVFSSLAAGTYAVNVKNEFQCAADTIVTIAKVNPPSFSASGFNPSCRGNDGIIALERMYLDMNVVYSLNGSSYSSTDSFKNLVAGTYTITSKNEAGCRDEKTVILTPASINTKGIRIASSNPICSANNGSIQITAENLKEPASFSVNGVSSTTTNQAKLAAGMYKIIITDGNACTFDTSVVLTTNPIPAIDSIRFKANCSNDPGKGEIAVFAKNTGEAFAYSVNDGSANATGRFTSLNAGIYQVKVSNKYGCAVDTTINIAMIPAPSFSTTVANPTCTDNNGTITVQSIVSQMSVKYSLNQSAFEDKRVFNNLHAGTYKISAINESYCTTEKTVVLALPSINKNGISISSRNATCNLPNGAIEIAAQNVTEPVLYALNGSPSSTGSFKNLSASSYKLSVKDGNDCIFDTIVAVSSIPVIKPKTEFVQVQPTCPGTFDGSISLTISGSQAPYTVSLNTSLYAPSYRYVNLKADSYNISIRNAENCLADSFTVRLTVPPDAVCSSIYFPSAFTPNGDGKNELFKPAVYGVLETYSLLIFNRMGQKVAELKDPKQGWDGIVNGLQQPTSTFVWYCNYKFYGGEQTRQLQKGTVLLVR